MECEPYITADDMLLREHADNVIKGIEVIAHLLKPHHVMIGIEDNKPQAIRALELAAKNTDLNLDIIVVPTIYPSGGEKQLIKLLTGVEVPSGKIPADVGIVCQNVGTAAAIYDAVYHGVPLISRIVTLAGEALTHPHNMRALIGTPLKTLLETAGVNQQALYRIVVGGPMMGFTVDSQSIPMIKTTNCIIAATYAEMPPAPPANPVSVAVCVSRYAPPSYYLSNSTGLRKGKSLKKQNTTTFLIVLNVVPALTYVQVTYLWFSTTVMRKRRSERKKRNIEKRTMPDSALKRDRHV